MPQALRSQGIQHLSQVLRGSQPAAELFVAKAVPNAEAQLKASDRLALESVSVRRLETGDECVALGPKLARSGRCGSILHSIYYILYLLYIY